MSAAELADIQKAAQEADSPDGPIVPSGSSESFGTRNSEDVTPSCIAVLANPSLSGAAVDYVRVTEKRLHEMAVAEGHTPVVDGGCDEMCRFGIPSNSDV